MTASGTFSFYYNSDNQLIKIEQSGNELASYEYNWQGLRSKKVTPSKTEYYYYTGNDLEYITDGSNNLKYYFVRDTNGVLLQMIDYSNYPTTAAKTYNYTRDLHGNIVALADESGNRVLNYEYDAWGLLLNTPETVTTANGELLSNANPFRYSGYRYDPETGLYYLKYRYYSAGIGRFLTRDPMISRNRYAYVGNNPVNLVDPIGLYQALPEYSGGKEEVKQPTPITNPRAKQPAKYHERSPKSFSPEMKATLELEGRRFAAGIEEGIEEVIIDMKQFVKRINDYINIIRK